MIYSRIIFPIKQRIFWREVKKKLSEWSNMIRLEESATVITSDKIYYNLHKDDLLSSVIYAGNFEWAEKEWLKSFLKPGMTFYDIGTNIGFYSLIAAKIVGPTGKVYSLEPSSLTYQRLNDNIELNSSLKTIITTYEIAASDKISETQMYVSKNDFHAWNSMTEPHNSSDFHAETIKTATIDNLYKTEKWNPPHLIKIDIEGWEEFALKGATEILTEHHPAILIEFTREHLERTGSSYNNLINQLKSIGYTLNEYLPRYQKLNPINDWDFEHKNIIAIYPNH